MASPKAQIEQRIRDLMIAESDFDSLNYIIRGFPYLVPEAWFPIAQILIPSESTISEQTGLNIREYVGFIRFDFRMQDNPQITGRKVDLPSYLSVEEMVNAAVQFFRQLSNRKLNNLLESGVWAVRDFELGSEAEYGLDSRVRENNFENYGLTPFRCETQEVKTA